MPIVVLLILCLFHYVSSFAVGFTYPTSYGQAYSWSEVKWANVPANTTKLRLIIASSYNLTEADYASIIADDLPPQLTKYQATWPNSTQRGIPYWLLLQASGATPTQAMYGAFSVRTSVISLMH